MTALRWGIMGTGGIAAEMAGTLQRAGSIIQAVGSARANAAESFAHRWSIPQPVGSHRAVAEIDEVDVVYVATTNDLHYHNVIDCIELGKPVLCEKPIALNGRRAREMLQAAADAGVFVMEAMWMRFLPFLATLNQLIDAGEIGDVRHIQASFMYMAKPDPTRRWFSRELGGGSLLDLGIYPLTLAHLLLGPPLGFEAQAQLADTGVDIETQVISQHAGGASAALTSGFTADTANEAIVSGTEGRIRLSANFHESPQLTLERLGEIEATSDTSYEGHGFQFEVAEVERCLAAGLTESPLRPHADTLAVMDWMDEIRTKVGIEYDTD